MIAIVIDAVPHEKLVLDIPGNHRVLMEFLCPHWNNFCVFILYFVQEITGHSTQIRNVISLGVFVYLLKSEYF